jgi:hypothetical protein
MQFSVEPASHSIHLRIFDNGIFHGIDTYDHRKTRATTGFSWLIDNRVGVGKIHNILINKNKISQINNIICIINGIFHGIFRPRISAGHKYYVGIFWGGHGIDVTIALTF